MSYMFDECSNLFSISSNFILDISKLDNKNDILNDDYDSSFLSDTSKFEFENKNKINKENKFDKNLELNSFNKFNISGKENNESINFYESKFQSLSSIKENDSYLSNETVTEFYNSNYVKWKEIFKIESEIILII